MRFFAEKRLYSNVDNAHDDDMAKEQEFDYFAQIMVSDCDAESILALNVKKDAEKVIDRPD
jgi:hypothetical protein